MLLTSTRAVAGATVDALSDYDVILVVDDIQPFVDDRSWLEDFGDVLVVYWDQVHPNPAHGTEQCGNVTQYSDGLKIDFTLWPVALLRQIAGAAELDAELDAGYRVLLDKDGLCAALRPPTFRAYIPTPPTPEAYQTLVNDFLTDAPYVAKCLWRDELLPARWCLDFDMKYNYLFPLLEWRVEIDHSWSVPVGLNGKGLKKRLPPATWAALEQTYAGARLEENWAALDRTLALFRQVASEVGEKLGYAYPEQLHRGVCEYVDRIRQMPPSGHARG
jgi:aminoglycoside 6-adenylyltransferase